MDCQIRHALLNVCRESLLQYYVKQSITLARNSRYARQESMSLTGTLREARLFDLGAGNALLDQWHARTNWRVH